MAKELNFVLGSKTYAAAPVKLDRKKMYGWSTKVAFDHNGKECDIAYLNTDDSQLLPSGAVKQGIVDDSGRWIERGDLVACDEQGNKLEMHESSFNVMITLNKRANSQEFLDNEWEQVYQLDNNQLLDAVGSDIYSFPFSYKGGVNSLDAYLIGTDNGLFLLAGRKIDFAPLTLREEAIIDESDVELVDEDIDELDFGMF